MNAKTKMCAVIGLVLIAGFACGYLFAGVVAPASQMKEVGVELSAYASTPSGELIVVSVQNYTFPMGTAGLQLGTNTTFVRENKIESWGITLHNI
jgi:hypothetical protein